ncbi:MAG: hypothetical protein VCA74_07695 [Deltaproteobacteria bacterium]
MTMPKVGEKTDKWNLAVVCVVALLAAGCTALPKVGWGWPRPKAIPAANRARAVEVARPTEATRYVVPVMTKTERVVTKTYEVGKQASAARGDVLFSVRRYTASSRVTHAVVTRDFRQACAPAPGRKDSPSGELRRRGPAARRAASQTPKSIDYAGDTVGREPALACRVWGLKSLFSTRCNQPVSGPLNPQTAPVGAALDPAYACRKGPLRHLAGSRGQSLPVVGTVDEGDDTYYALEVYSDKDRLYLLVDEQGRLSAQRYALWRERESVKRQPAGMPVEALSPGIHLDPTVEIVRLEKTDEFIGEAAKAMHFDVVYKGMSRDGDTQYYHLLYREYRRDTPDRFLHMRDLAYPVTERGINLAGVKVNVNKVSAQKILYTVVAD